MWVGSEVSWDGLGYDPRNAEARAHTDPRLFFGTRRGSGYAAGMTLYPASPRRRTATILGDLATLALVLLFAWLGVKVHDGVAELAGLGRGLQDAGVAVGGTARDAAGAVRDGFGSAADAVDGAPLVGGEIADALRSAGESAAGPVEGTGVDSGERLTQVGRDAEATVYDTANLLGWLTFLIPSLLVLSRWLPSRVQLVRRLTGAARVLRAGPLDPERERELARRAAYGLPYDALLRHTRDPLGDLLAGRHAPLLAALGEDAGVKVRAGRA